jgi:hypothetical protein
VLFAILRPLAVALVVLTAQRGSSTVLLTDSRGTEVVVTGASIDYGSLLSVDRETRGVRVLQGDGLVLLKWDDLDTLRVTRLDSTAKPPRVELDVVLRTHKHVPATLLRAGKMQLVGRTDLGEYAISLDKIRRIVPVR